jgi:glucosyl-3-phosphoglycerate phosphatase
MTRILLVRHGESEWNAIRRLQGQADIDLSERGRAQADALRQTIASLAPARVVTSDLKRAADTAALLGFPEAERRRDLRENDVGDWTGRSIAELKAEAADSYRGWRAGTVTPPGGESWQAFRARTSEAILGLSSTCEGPLLAVCHGGVVRALLESFLDLTPERIIPVGPASLTILRRPVGADARIRLELFNFNPTGPVLDAPD